MNAIQISPAIMFKGHPPECRQCLTEIPIGSPSVRGGRGDGDGARYGTTPGLIQYHAECFKRAQEAARAQETALAPDPQGASSGHQTHGAAGDVDIGDAVADELDRLLGRTPATARAAENSHQRVHAAAVPQVKDIGDAVADALELQLFGEIRGVRS